MRFSPQDRSRGGHAFLQSHLRLALVPCPVGAWRGHLPEPLEVARPGETLEPAQTEVDGWQVDPQDAARLRPLQTGASRPRRSKPSLAQITRHNQVLPEPEGAGKPAAELVLAEAIPPRQMQDAAHVGAEESVQEAGQVIDQHR